MSLVSQEPTLFAASIRDNIRYGRPNASDAEVVEAAKMANAHWFIEAFPQGYDTFAGERGSALSGKYSSFFNLHSNACISFSPV